ncbi:hypothetical protein DY000_02040038 [Brassica cretica]|uniref:Uncharacterized protein n=1 Tax=Brassica cretica TaxID=69181 RepID=A0ABQ7BLW8_BRACR|nr:hypothetical protein DY000_02040038 [Brassica cretica]
MDFQNWDPGNRWVSGDYGRIGHLYSSGIKGIRKIHGDAEGKDQLNLKEGFKGKGKIGGFTGYWAKTRDSYWIWLRGLRLRSPISKDLYGLNTGLRLSMIISFQILDLVIVKTKLRDSEEVTWLEVLTSEDLFLRKFWSWVVVININGGWFSLYGGQLIGNSGDMKSGEGILIFMDQDLLVVRSSQQVMASGIGVLTVLISSMSICLSSGFKVIMGLGLGQLIGNSGDMKSGEGILIFMDQDLLVVRSSQQVMASAMLLFMFKQWNNIGVMDCWYWYSLQLIGLIKPFTVQKLM